jgi:hypothetical protein
MKKHIVKLTHVLTLLLLGACCSSEADSPFEVSMLNSQYTTYVMVQGTNGESGTITQAGDFQLWPWGNSRMTVSPAPVSDEMYAPVSGLLSAQAGAEIFGVSAYSSMGGFEHEVDVMAGAHNATAGAEGEISFSPLVSGTVNLELDFAGNYEWFYSQGFANLIDLTSGQTLWAYGWNMSDESSWIRNANGTASAIYSLETTLSVSDTYALTMYTQTFSDSDAEEATIQLSGLEVVPESPGFTAVGTGGVVFVPEPSLFNLAGFGVAVLLILHRFCIMFTRPSSQERQSKNSLNC